MGLVTRLVGELILPKVHPPPYTNFLPFLAELSFFPCLFPLGLSNDLFILSSLCFPIRYLYVDIPVD
jgi:hypothetical protein